MSKTAMVRARLEPKLKQHTERIFHRIGLNATQAIGLFYKQVELRNGLPFAVVIPGPATKHTFDATDKGRDLIVCRDATPADEPRGRTTGPERVSSAGKRMPDSYHAEENEVKHRVHASDGRKGGYP